MQNANCIHGSEIGEANKLCGMSKGGGRKLEPIDKPASLGGIWTLICCDMTANGKDTMESSSGFGLVCLELPKCWYHQYDIIASGIMIKYTVRMWVCVLYIYIHIYLYMFIFNIYLLAYNTTNSLCFRNNYLNKHNYSAPMYCSC